MLRYTRAHVQRELCVTYNKIGNHIFRLFIGNKKALALRYSARRGLSGTLKHSSGDWDGPRAKKIRFQGQSACREVYEKRWKYKWRMEEVWSSLASRTSIKAFFEQKNYSQSFVLRQLTSKYISVYWKKFLWESGALLGLGIPTVYVLY